MSRIGKKPIEIPQGVEVKMNDGVVTAKGTQGTLSYTIPSGISVDIQDKEIVVTRATEQKRHRALHGLVRSLLHNIVIGVSTGFSKTLVIEGIGYRVSKQGNGISLAVGYSHPVDMPAPDGVTFDVEGQNRIIIKGADKQKVGQVAANIRRVRPPEPYKGKGIRYSDEVVRRKVGKTGA
jgi:large subunit ribosomal protein L6